MKIKNQNKGSLEGGAATQLAEELFTLLGNGGTKMNDQKYKQMFWFS